MEPNEKLMQIFKDCESLKQTLNYIQKLILEKTETEKEKIEYLQCWLKFLKFESTQIEKSIFLATI